jgi:hypothetical protein
MSVTNKTTSNTSNVSTTTLSASSIQSLDKMMENLQVVTPNLTVAPFFPYTLDYNKGSVFYIPTTYNPQGNFSVIVTNLPVNKNKAYTISLIFTSATTTAFYCNQIKASDTNGVYYLGSSGAFGTPLYNGGVNSLTTATSNIIIQQFSMINIPDSTGANNNLFVTSSINNFY